MPHDRYFVEESIELGSTLVLAEEESHHMLHVMRKGEGDSVEIVNGRGLLATASIIKREKRRATLHVDSIIRQSPAKNPRVILCQAIPRMSRAEWIVEKATELGADSIHFFPSDRSERAEISEKGWFRLRQIAISALKQSGRLVLPQLLALSPLSSWEVLEPLALFGDLSEEAEWLLPNLSENVEQFKQVTWYIGPEGGFTARESERLRELGGRGVKFNRNILRAETAAMAALSITICALSTSAER